MSTTQSAKIIDRSWQITYKLAFWAARFWWWLRHPDHNGAVVAIWVQGRILVVQQSYRTNPSWPGGGIRPNEHPREAAQRELVEELSLDVQPDDLVLVRETVVEWDFRCEHVWIFELHLPSEPIIKIDKREIISAWFLEPQTLLTVNNLPPFMLNYLSDVIAHQSG